MRSIASALSELDADAVRRVLRWATERFLKTFDSDTSARDSMMAERTTQYTAFSGIADFFAAAQPKSGPEKALVAGYWLQVIEGHDDIDAQALNSELKNMGHALANVTKSLSALMWQSPALAVQTRKSGTSRQARKRYRLTTEGVRRVRQMIGESGPDDLAPR